jgi:starch synthase
LDDTIIDYACDRSGNGFKFEDYTSAALLEKLQEAKRFYRNKKEWERIMLNGMKCDFSWDASAKKYEELYHKAISYKRG